MGASSLGGGDISAVSVVPGLTSIRVLTGIGSVRVGMLSELSSELSGYDGKSSTASVSTDARVLSSTTSMMSTGAIMTIVVMNARVMMCPRKLVIMRWCVVEKDREDG